MAPATDLERQVCFYNDTPLMRRDFERFGFEIFLSRGYRVTFLDMTRVLNPDYLTSFEPPELSDYQEIVVANDRRDIVDFVQNNRRALAIVLPPFKQTTRFLFEALKKHDVVYVQYGTSQLPSFQPKSVGQKFRRLVEETKRLHIRYVVQALIRNIASQAQTRVGSLYTVWTEQRSGLKPPRYSLRISRLSRHAAPRLGKVTEIIGAHARDYDLYLELRKGTAKTASSYAVFLDNYYPFHPDYAVPGNPHPHLEPDRYYDGLNRFFDVLEGSSGLRVVIAAHPRSRYDEIGDYFGDRRVEKYKTAELVAGTTVVIAHQSRSINFAILFQKPIIFVTSDELGKTVHGAMISRFAESLGKAAINVDHEIELDLDRELLIDEAIYSRYTEDYIKIPGTPEKPSWEIVADKIDADYFGETGSSIEKKGVKAAGDGG